MAKIEFRGKTYNSEFEMPYEVRQAYQQEKEQQSEKDRQSGSARAKSLTEIVDMSPEVKAIYERALDNVEDNLPPSEQSKNLPKTEDIYRPSPPLIDPGKSVIEPESAFGLKRFLASVVLVLIVAAIAFLVLWFF